MALFTDGAISSIEDLLAYESEILGVATTEAIDVTVKLRLAEGELAIELGAFLARQRFSGTMRQIVVTDALHKCHTFRTLALVYRDAYHRQLNDRYMGKWKEYERLGQWAWAALLQTGIGVSGNPIERAVKPELGSTPGGATAATYFVRVSWCGNGNEGAPSEIAALTLTSGGLLTVRAAHPPGNASGWNVYGGYSAAELTKQNESAIALGATWTAPAAGLTNGEPLTQGQPPDYYLRPDRVLQRG